MTDISNWREECKKRFSPCWNDDDADFIESLLVEARREGVREVIERIPSKIKVKLWPLGSIVGLKKHLANKYLTPTGNLDQ